MIRARLGLTWLESRDVPDGGFEPPTVYPTPDDGGTSSYGYVPGSTGIDPGQGPIGGGETNSGGTPPLPPGP